MDGNQLGSEAELALFESGILQHFGDMAVLQNGVSREVAGHFAEVSFQARLAAGAGDAALGVADDTGGQVEHAGSDKGAQCEIGGGGIAAWIRDKPGAANLATVELGQAVDSFGQQFSGHRGLLIPTRIDFGRAQTESAA